MINGSPKFNGMAMGEGKFSFLGTTIHLEGKAAFIDNRTGQTHGWTHNTSWSKDTIDKLMELRAAMEVDLGRMHLDGGGEVLVVTGKAQAPVLSGGGDGLGEFLGGGAQQI
jgi:hypothetical protein